ncbi:hypothetical protein PUNSTDRAFT_120033 [Punctularia strigosozonata HHB-11173 SS5]|uniref:uncharacterized protein n=1 Tax=Punctularia strigosozonata (strain HHB-11173) TaxID=741275 RepID=UPI00044166AA|nr:uncharacterized protein PUNSTDRAFT_120033 [Punctularia strigosozonata HHB-11173 SS5]EIN09595.1 hypothetical protein PUNSTDRAFT_120033 [Punctularia strigosozonata HHB-11173 SS5]
MDLRIAQQEEATAQASSSSSTNAHSTSTTAQPESRATRSSARVRAAKEKERLTTARESSDLSSITAVDSTGSISQRITRSTVQASKAKRPRDQISAKGKGKEKDTGSGEDIASRPSKKSRRATYPVTAGISIQEPSRDTKGKKRAAPDSISEDEDAHPAGSSSISAPVKRTKTAAAYSLRSRIDTSTATVPSADMPRKTRTSPPKGKAALKSKISGSSSSRTEDDDTYSMMDVDRKAEAAEGEHAEGTQAEVNRDPDDRPNENDDEENDHDDDGEGDGEEHGDPESPQDHAHGRPAFDDLTAMAILGDYGRLGSFMLSMSTRIKSMLGNIKMSADPTTRLITLQELSELLSMSTEDTLAGSFPVEGYVRELVRILGGSGNAEGEDGEDGDDGGEGDEQDEDAQLAAAIAMSSGGAFRGDENLEAQVLACRCLANLMEALPGVAHTIVYHGALPVLCSKLLEISYIDLAEQTLSTLEKISEEFPSAIVREGGLAALLSYLDFFSIAVQRTALQAASNCCRNISSEHVSMLRPVWPIIRNCLSYSDQRLVEYACLCVIRVIDSYHRSHPQLLEDLVDLELIKAVNLLLLPAGGSPLIAANTFTLLLRALAISAKASPKITITLLEADIVSTLYQILTGVLPPASEGHEEQGEASGGQGLGGGLADMTVMENLAHRPKDQIEEALSLVSELMPPLPKDGVFDHKSYTEKSLSRMVKAKAKADRAAARQAAANAAASVSGLAIDTPISGSAPVTPSADEPPATEVVPVPSSEPSQSNSDEIAVASPVAPLDRTELLKSKPNLVGHFMRLMVPILVDVYAASVITPVRVKTLTGLLKAVSFQDDDGLRRVLECVPVASFASSILSSKDHPSLVIGALQLVEMLLTKVPEEYKPAFHREGVFHEIEALASRNLLVSRSKDKDKDKEAKDAPSSVLPPSDLASNASMPPPIPVVPSSKKSSSNTLDPEDAVTLRARVTRFKFLTDDMTKAADGTMKALQRLAESLSPVDASEEQIAEALQALASLFASSSVSSFELLQSGVVDCLLNLATDETRQVSVSRRQELLFATFTVRNAEEDVTPLAVLVKKLQESLTRMESYEVITVSQGSDDNKRSSPSLLARQLRLRLVAADDSDIPRNLNNMVVSIHAIATFQALHDYLRPRVSGLFSGNSRLLAAALASGFGAGPSSSRPSLSESLPSLSARPADEQGSSASAPAPTIARRRSQRLSAKRISANAEPDSGSSASTPKIAEASSSRSAESVSSISGPSPPPTASDPAGSTTVSAVGASEAAPSETLVGGEEDHDVFPDEDVDDEIIDDDMDPDTSMNEKTITLSLVDDGSRVEAKTPDGTRVATPRETVTPQPRKASYAAALKAKPTDWHLEFSMDDTTLPLDLTIYGAIHQHELRKKTGPSIPPNMIWQGIYTVKFKKVPGPAPNLEDRNDDGLARSRSPNLVLSSLPEDASHTKILRLLRVIHKLNQTAGEKVVMQIDDGVLAESAFVNNKLTAKLSRQLEEPMIVASSCLPDWALDLPQHFPFLFPFATRYNFLQSTSFGYARLILKWQSQQTRGQDSSRRDDSIAYLGRLQRQKVRISRKHILESAMKVFELYGSSSSVLEVEYFEEVGTGLGPTLEFYSLVSREFARRTLKLWRDADVNSPGLYVQHPTGLFPAPISPDDAGNDGTQKRTHIFRVIGQFVAKAMLDSRIIDMSYNKIFLKLVLGEQVPLTLETLKLVDADLASSLSKLRRMAKAKEEQEPAENVDKAESVNVEDLALDFTIPGYDIELKPGGRDIAVTADNVEEYIESVIDAIIGSGAQPQVQAFREGFSKVFPITDLQAFSADELAMLFGNTDEDWSVETLSEALKADHGFNVESRAIRNLVEIMAAYDAPTRRGYLQFITGSPKLPIGGFRGLNPPLTVVRKPHEPPLTADDYLPSVMTCVNYLKLPDYSSKEVMREKLHTAMKEGVGSFHLS